MPAPARVRVYPRVVNVPGFVGGGKYRLGAQLGRGGMGAVYAAETKDGRRFAIKILHPDLCEDAKLCARFQREAQIAQQISSPFVARVVENGRTRPKHGSLLWIAYELLVGETLDARLRRDGALALQAAQPIGDHMLQGLVAAHAARVVHRDIKPSNLFLCSDGRTCILDFGVSKFRAAGLTTSQAHLTTDNETLGTMDYMPPEQLGNSGAVDARADLYSAGTVLFQMIAGGLPFGRSSLPTRVRAKLNRDAPSLGEVTGTEWPEPIEAFFRRALARDRAARFDSAGAMLKAWKLVTGAGHDAPERRSFRDRSAALPASNATEPQNHDTIRSSTDLRDRARVSPSSREAEDQARPERHSSSSMRSGL